MEEPLVGVVSEPLQQLPVLNSTAVGNAAERLQQPEPQAAVAQHVASLRQQPPVAAALSLTDVEHVPEPLQQPRLKRSAASSFGNAENLPKPITPSNVLAENTAAGSESCAQDSGVSKSPTSMPVTSTSDAHFTPHKPWLSVLLHSTPPTASTDAESIDAATAAAALTQISSRILSEAVTPVTPHASASHVRERGSSASYPASDCGNEGPSGPFLKYRKVGDDERGGTSLLNSSDSVRDSGSFQDAATRIASAGYSHDLIRERSYPRDTGARAGPEARSCGRVPEQRQEADLFSHEVQQAKVFESAVATRTDVTRDSAVEEDHTPAKMHASVDEDMHAGAVLVSQGNRLLLGTEEGSDPVESTAAAELTDVESTYVICTFCDAKQMTDSSASKKRPVHRACRFSERAQGWLSMIFPSIHSLSGHGGMEVKAPDSVVVSDLVEAYPADGTIICCTLCAELFEKAKKRSRRTATEVDGLVASFYRRRNRPTKPPSCYYCDKIQESFGLNTTVTSAEEADVGFDFRFRYLDPETPAFRSISEALAFRLGLSVSVVAHFFRNTDTLCLCNKHKQMNRRMQDLVSHSSSTCVVPGCGSVFNLTVLRAPEDGDFSIIEDALSIALDGSLSLSDVVDFKICSEHFALLTRARRKPSRSISSLIAEMKSFRGEAVSGFVVRILEAFGIDSRCSSPFRPPLAAQEAPTQAQQDLSLTDFPQPLHGIIYFKTLFDYYNERVCVGKKMHRRTLLSILASALAPFNVHTDKDSHSGFIYFCCPQILIEGVRSTTSTSGGLTSTFVRALDSERERAELLRLGEFFTESRSDILAGRFKLREIVLCISPWYWVYHSWTLASGRQRDAWVAKAKTRRLENPSYIWPCGNRDDSLPSGDILETLTPSSVTIVRRVLTEIERRVTTLTGTYGPVGIGVGALVHMRGSKSLQVPLFRLGLCCSYSEMLKIRAGFTRRRNAHPSKAFASIPENSLVCMSLDNADFSLPNAIDVSGKNTNGEHFTFASVHAMKIPPASSTRSRREMAFKDPIIRFPTRELFVGNFSTKEDDPDLAAYSTVLLGRVWQLRDRLQSRDPKTQLSLRHVLFSSMEVFPAQDSVVIYAKLEDFKASDANELLRIIEDAVIEMLPGEPGRYEMLAVSGDFPVIWIVWKEWVKRLALARTEGKELKWFPFPSGAAFHDLKVGALPTLKMIMEGALVEDMIKNGRAGLSKWYCENWNLVGNLRKNRRVNDSVIVSSILAAIPTLRSEDPELDTALDKRDGDCVDELQVQDIIYQSGSNLRVSQAVTQKVFADGSAIRRSMLQFGNKHRNAALYLRLFLLELLIPTTALQILSRCGQTSIYQKFYFNLSPFIMQTTKSSYQKHSVMTMHILAVLPDCIVADIFGGSPGALVVNTGKNPFANLPQDETTETGILDIKKLPIRKKENLLKAVTWCGEVSRIGSALLSALNLEGKSGSFCQSKEDRKWDKDGILTLFDKEHGGATNVSEFLEFVRLKGQFSADNMKKQYLCNVLPDTAVELREGDRIEALLSMRSSGEKKLHVLVSRMIPGYIESTWRPEDLALMGLKKQPARVGAWTRSGAVRTMAHYRSDALAAEHKTSSKSLAELDGERTYNTFTKKWNTRVQSLLPVIANEENRFSVSSVNTARTLLSHLYQIAHISCPLSLCYRRGDVSFKPGFGLECRQLPADKSRFFRTLLGEAASLNLPPGLDLGFLTEDGRHPNQYDIVQFDVENVAHHALQKTVRSSTVAEVMEEQMSNQLRPVLTGARSAKLKHLHLHCDYADATIQQKKGTQALRDERRATESSTTESRDFCEQVTSATIRRSEKEGFTTGYLFFGALAAIKLGEGYNSGLQDGSDERNLSIFLHGGSFAIYDDAMNVSIKLLGVVKCPNTSAARVLIYNKEKRKVLPQIVAGSFESGVTVYPRRTCFVIRSNMRLQICAGGSSSHGEAETRFIFAFNSISRPALRRSEESQCLILSNDSDCPAISVACSNITKGAKFVHKVSSQFIHIDKLLTLLNTLHLSSDALVGCFALGGCDFTPATAGVSQMFYVRALMQNCNLLGGWKNLGQYPLVQDGCIPSDVEAVILTGLAFIQKYRACIPESERVPSFLASGCSTGSLWSNIESWLVQLRKAVAKKSSLTSSSFCLPETSDIILQGRRACFVLRYWQGSHHSTWDRDTVGGVSEEWGYCEDEKGDCWPLFEKDIDVKARKEKMAFPFTKCGCLECKTRTCSCRKADLVCIPGLCGRCEGSCHNTGLENGQVSTQNDHCSTLAHETEDQPRPQANVVEENIITVESDAEDQDDCETGDNFIDLYESDSNSSEGCESS